LGDVEEVASIDWQRLDLFASYDARNTYLVSINLKRAGVNFNRFR